MSVYRIGIHVRRHTHPRLDNEGLRRGINLLISDAAIIDFEQLDSLHERLSLQVEREDYREALNEVLEAAQRLGYTLLEIEIGELVDQAVKATILGAVSVGGAAHATERNPWLTAFATVVGGYVANRAAAQIERYEVIYRLPPSPAGFAPAQTVGSWPIPAV